MFKCNGLNAVKQGLITLVINSDFLNILYIIFLIDLCFIRFFLLLRFLFLMHEKNVGRSFTYLIIRSARFKYQITLVHSKNPCPHDSRACFLKIDTSQCQKRLANNRTFHKFWIYPNIAPNSNHYIHLTQ